MIRFLTEEKIYLPMEVRLYTVCGLVSVGLSESLNIVSFIPSSILFLSETFSSHRLSWLVLTVPRYPRTTSNHCILSSHWFMDTPLTRFHWIHGGGMIMELCLLLIYFNNSFVQMGELDKTAVYLTIWFREKWTRGKQYIPPFFDLCSPSIPNRIHGSIIL